ncbi:MAG: type II secretion system minor pseudopilin GspK [Burkholderiaceae bacterium]
MRTAGRQRGAAIITAMLVVTLASVVVSGLFWREHVAVRSIENRLALAQNRWIERAALDWAKVILRGDLRAGPVDHLGEPWAVPVLDTRMDETVTAGAKLNEGARNALLAGQISDAQARFNLTSLANTNGLRSDPAVKAFRKLLSVVGKPESVADLVVERVLQSQPRNLDGRAVPAQRPPMTRLADLLDIPGLDPSVVPALEPHAIVLPRATTVNVNTAGAEVLAAMIEPLDLSSARRFVARRERTFYRTIEQAANEIDGRPSLNASLLSVGSSFFLVSGVIRYDRVESQTETLLERMSDRVEVVWQLRL